MGGAAGFSRLRGGHHAGPGARGPTCHHARHAGRCLADRGEITAAINQFQQAIRARPDYDQPYYNLGLAYSKQGRIREAREMFKTALKKNSGNDGAREMLNTLQGR